MITATNPITGEMFEIKDDTPADLEQAYQVLKSFERTTKKLLDQWKERVTAYDSETLETPHGYIKCSVIQRQTYDKGILRQLIDEDTLDDFLVIKKSSVDNWLKERVEKQDIDMDLNRSIRAALIPDGMPFVTIKYEKTK
jgi:hypothetical protein